MIAEIKIDGKTAVEKKQEDALKAKIRALVAEIKRAYSEHGAQVIPRYWELGSWLALLNDTTSKEKYDLAGGTYPYYVARQIVKRFSSLEEARAFKGSLNNLVALTKRRASRTIEKLVKDLLKAAKGNGRKVLRLLIKQASWRISEVSEWLQVEELEARRTGPDRNFFD